MSQIIYVNEFESDLQKTRQNVQKGKQNNSEWQSSQTAILSISRYNCYRHHTPIKYKGRNRDLACGKEINNRSAWGENIILPRPRIVLPEKDQREGQGTRKAENGKEKDSAIQKPEMILIYILFLWKSIRASAHPRNWRTFSLFKNKKKIYIKWKIKHDE